MIKDRGIKWTAMMLPDHVHLLKEARFDEERIQKPVLDVHEIDELEIRILEAMETNSPLVFNRLIKNRDIEENNSIKKESP
jgi:hypothetical protein